MSSNEGDSCYWPLYGGELKRCGAAETILRDVGDEREKLSAMFAEVCMLTIHGTG
ncbi:MAG: hypothetical protein OXC63_13855 [Aestuariivita sp.]|nr:hypothetical protein [Aestuariivita sp.]